VRLNTLLLGLETLLLTKNQLNKNVTHLINYKHLQSLRHTSPCVHCTYFAGKRNVGTRISGARNIRNLAVIAHVDHGKTTLSDALLLKAGLLNKNNSGDQNCGRKMDSLKDEIDRGITIKSASVTLNYLVKKALFDEKDRPIHPIKVAGDVGSQEDSDEHLPLQVNLIDSPGHIDFNAEVTAALRVTDGALVVVDAIEGKAVQTEEVLIQALKEGVTPVLMINKVDRLIIEKQLSPDEVFDRMQCVIDDVNDFIATHQMKNLPDQRVSLLQGSVCFGSGYFGWACSIDGILDRLHNVAKERAQLRKSLAKRDHFIKNVIIPIVRMHRACGVLPVLKKEKSELDRVSRVNELLSRIPWSSNLRLSRKDNDSSHTEPRKFLKKVMMEWLPAADALVDMVAVHVPSPEQAQKWRAPIVYSGDIEDECGQGISNCDAQGPTVVYISKMSSGASQKGLLAFGRVFSGTIRPGDKLRALRNDGKETKAKISGINICGIGGKMHAIELAEAGQLIALEGIDKALDKSGTLTSSSKGKAISHMRFSVTPIVQHSLWPKDKTKLQKMASELQKITSADPSALFYRDKETQEYILAGAGELHIEVLLSSLLQNSGIDVEVSKPVIAYRETVQYASRDVALAKSENKHNRLWIRASPLNDNIVDAMCSELANTRLKVLAETLVKDHGWSKNEAGRIWATGPEPLDCNDKSNNSNQPTCLLVDSTYGVQIPQDARENIIEAFKQVVRKGVIVNAPMRGVRFDLMDIKLHSDSVHRRPSSVVPAAMRAMRGAFLVAAPSLMEPMYHVDIRGKSSTLEGVYSILGKRGGTVMDTSSSLSMDVIVASMPVRCAFGLAGDLRGATHGHASCSCVFNGMKRIPEEEEGFVISEARLRKQLDEKVPNVDSFVDKL